MKFRIAMCLRIFGLPVMAQENVREAPISQFRTLPRAIRQDLRKRGCTVPQSPGALRLENVIRGHFRDPKQTDWAVLCDSTGMKTSMILVYWNANPQRPSVLGRAPLANQPCWGTISRVGKAYILEHYRAYGGPKPPALDHQGIEVGICEKASTISYFHRGRWLTLTGAD